MRKKLWLFYSWVVSCQIISLSVIYLEVLIMQIDILDYKKGFGSCWPIIMIGWTKIYLASSCMKLWNQPDLLPFVTSKLLQLLKKGYFHPAELKILPHFCDFRKWHIKRAFGQIKAFEIQMHFTWYLFNCNFNPVAKMLIVIQLPSMSWLQHSIHATTA